jgi:4-hydroxy-tetrahydrodipicolinate synthase
MTTTLRGVLVALATPFTADGSLDEAGLRALVDRTIDGGPRRRRLRLHR